MNTFIVTIQNPKNHAVVQELSEEQIPTANDTEKQVLARYELKDVLKEIQKSPNQMREIIFFIPQFHIKAAQNEVPFSY